MNVSKFKDYDKIIIERYQKGDSSCVLSKDIGCTDQTIIYRLEINGIKIRSTSEANRGRPFSKEHIEKISKSKIEKGSARGFRNPNWKGGISDNWSKLRFSQEYVIWRKSVFEKDNYTCRGCGYDKGHTLQAHHILRRVDFPHLIFAIDNGITLCKNCHKKIHSKRANLQLGELLGNPTVKSGTISSRALYQEKVQRLCTQPEKEDIVRSA
jgi:hypothetical protein